MPAAGTPAQYNTIGRNDSLTTFIDNTAIAGKQYIYKVQAVDHHCNRSVPSDSLQAAPLAEQGLICQLQFDGTLADNSPNHLDASLYGTATYSSPSALVKSGTHSLSLNGSTYAMLPYSAVHHEAITIAAWVRYNTSGGNWQRLFDFGNGTHSYIPSAYAAPHNGYEVYTCRYVFSTGDEVASKLASALTGQHR